MLVGFPTPCRAPEIRKKRTFSGSGRSLPAVSVWSSEAALTQYSLAELTSIDLGQVSLARQSSLRPPVLPETGSSSTGKAKGNNASG